MKIIPMREVKTCDACGCVVEDELPPLIKGTLVEVLEYLYERQEDMSEQLELWIEAGIGFDGGGEVELRGKRHLIRLTGWKESMWPEEDNAS